MQTIKPFTNAAAGRKKSLQRSIGRGASPKVLLSPKA
jgi:hypothetical protein